MDHYTLYKQALKKQYAAEKLGRHSSFLLAPTEAKLRDLCIQLLNENADQRDRQIFHNFLGFDFDKASIQKIKNEKDRFKPIVTFLKNKTEIADTNTAAADMTAFLLNFTNRPFSNFYKNPVAGPYIPEMPTVTEKGTETGPTIITEPDGETSIKNNSFRKKVTFAICIIAVAFMGYVAKQELYPEKKCAEWVVDHYEPVSCKGSEINSFYKPRIVKFNEDLLHFKKITVSPKTKFFINGQPAVWYSKKDNTVEFFNAPGIHPITGISLKPITPYIAEKYGL